MNKSQKRKYYSELSRLKEFFDRKYPEWELDKSTEKRLHQAAKKIALYNTFLSKVVRFFKGLFRFIKRSYK